MHRHPVKVAKQENLKVPIMDFNTFSDPPVHFAGEAFTIRAVTFRSLVDRNRHSEANARAFRGGRVAFKDNKGDYAAPVSSLKGISQLQEKFICHICFVEGYRMYSMIDCKLNALKCLDCSKIVFYS